MHMSVCVHNQATCILEGTILHVCVPGPHHTVTDLRNVCALSDTEKSVFKRKIHHGSLKSESLVDGSCCILLSE